MAGVQVLGRVHPLPVEPVNESARCEAVMLHHLGGAAHDLTRQEEIIEVYRHLQAVPGHRSGEAGGQGSIALGFLWAELRHGQGAAEGFLGWFLDMPKPNRESLLFQPASQSVIH